MSNLNYAQRQETMYYDATKETYITRNMDVAAYLEYNLSQTPEINSIKTQYGPKTQFIFRNELKIRDLLELYDRGEALVEPKLFSEIKIQLIKKRNELCPKPNRVEAPARAGQTQAQPGSY